MVKTTQNDTTRIVIVALLVLNILLGVYIAFIKPDAHSLEVLKAGWRENMNMATQLYESDAYIQQQEATLQQILGSMDQAKLPIVDDSQIDVEDDSNMEIEGLELE